jgi:hypothetical protein
VPDALNPVVQKMIDAGESEENIATVIKHYKAQAAPSTVSPTETGDYWTAFGKSLKDDAGRAMTRIGHGALESLPGIGAVVGGVLSTPETGGIGTVPGIALGAGAGKGVRDMIAAGLGMEKPSTAVGEGARIAGETALTAGAAAILPGAVAAAKTPVQTLREGAEHFADAMPASIRRLGRLIPSAPKTAAPILERPAWQSWGEPEAAAAPAASAPAAAPQASAPTSALSDLDFAKAEVAAGRQPPSIIAALERAQQGPAKTPPGMIRGSLKPITVDPKSAMQPPSVTGKAATLADSSSATDELGSLMDAIHGPDAPSAGNGTMRGPRVQVGAEVVGRQNGLTKQAVREQVGPLFNEAQGEASPVIPQTPFERLHDKLLSMGHGNPERDAYVQAARDPKTAGQLEVIRRTLERNGLSVAAATSAAEAIRRAVMQRLTGEQQ